MYPTDRSLSAPSPFRFCPLRSRRSASWPRRRFPRRPHPRPTSRRSSRRWGTTSSRLRSAVGRRSFRRRSSRRCPPSLPLRHRLRRLPWFRKGTKLDASSSSAAASWLSPAVAPGDLSAELTAIQEGERPPAPTMADEEVVTFGAMQAPLGNPPAVVVDFSGDIGPDLGGPGGRRHWRWRPSGGADAGAGGLSGAVGGCGGAGGTTSASTPPTSSATALVEMLARHRCLRRPQRHPRRRARRPDSWRLAAEMMARHRRLLHPRRHHLRRPSRLACRRIRRAAPSFQGGQYRRIIGFGALQADGGHGKAPAGGADPASGPREQLDDYAERSATMSGPASSSSSAR